MDNEILLTQFETIEKKVETLIAAHQALENKNAELKTKIEQLESELRERTESETRSQEVKALIRTKIDGLLERLDGIAEAEG